MKKKYKNLGRLATTISIVRWIAIVAMVGYTAYVVIARVGVLMPRHGFGGMIDGSGWIAGALLVGVIIMAFFIWLGVEVVVQVLRHFMRMEMAVVHGPEALAPMGQFQAPPSFGQAPPMPPAEFIQPDQGPPPMPPAGFGQPEQGSPPVNEGN